MTDLIIRIFTLLGSLGIFLYGMKMMSEALQQVAGKRMRRILSAMTANRIKGLLSGLVITGAVQSSSAITVLVVSFVNAGLLSLEASISIIFGANIGTTFTAWLLGLLGFTFNIGKLALPMIGLSFPLILSRNRKRKSWGEFIFGLSLLFLGLEYIKNVLPHLHESPETISFLFELTDNGVWSVLLFVLVGLGITALFQSSSASMALILAMAYKGLIQFDIAAAMVIGMNIGTTITANLAAVVANNMAKRAARAHFLFNVLGALWALVLFRPCLSLVDWIFYQTSGISILILNPINLEESMHALPLALALYHTLFNLFTSILLFPFIKKLASITWFFTRQANALQEFKLKFLSHGLLNTSELSTLEARQQIANFGRIITQIFHQVSRQFFEMDEKIYAKWQSKVASTEETIDTMRLDISEYLTNLSAYELSPSGSKVISSMQRIVGDLESIGDVCFELSRTIDVKVKQKIWFSQDQRDNLQLVFDSVARSIQIMNRNLENDYSEVEGKEAMEAEQEIDNLRSRLQQAQVEEMKESSFRPDAGSAYRDILNLAEQIGDHIMEITRAILDSQTKKRRGQGNNA